MNMSVDVLLLRLRRHGQWLLALTLLVILVQGVAASRSLPRAVASDPLSEVCTAHGMQSVIPGNHLPATNKANSSHDCCIACVGVASGTALAHAPFTLTPAQTPVTARAAAVAPDVWQRAYFSPPSRAPPLA